MLSSDTDVIDGSHGEGGGQILRTSVGLAAMTGRAVRVEQVRGGRPRPGLAAQHLTSVRAAAAICGARLVGDVLGSSTLEFAPAHSPRAAEYTFDVAEARIGGSAGSVTLVLQTVLVPLALAPGPSTIVLRGGTHVPHSPPVDYVRDVWLPGLRAMGLHAELELTRVGWYPAGGGEIHVRVPGHGRVLGWKGVFRGSLLRVAGRALTSQLPSHVGERMRTRALSELRVLGVPVNLLAERAEAHCAGAGLFLHAVYEGGQTGSSSIGQRGRRAETVADDAVRDLLATHHAGACIDEHLADQLLAAAAVGSGSTEFATARATPHLRTNAWVIERFGLARVRIEERQGPARVRVEPSASTTRS